MTTKPLILTMMTMILTMCLTRFAAGQTGVARVDILDPPSLAKLDVPGMFSLATLLGEAQAEKDFLRQTPGLTRLKVMRLAELTRLRNPKYSAIVQAIESDLGDVQKLSGEKMAYSSEQAEILAPGGNVARHFDAFWLSSAMAAFPLIAVVHRADKAEFYPGTCGELRFIYRLAYSRVQGSQESRSTLPFFLNLVFDYPVDPDGGCVGAAQDWNAKILSGDMAGLLFKQIELNMQIVRFPSAQKTDFGGQALYLFRIFRQQNGQFAPYPLENTPNVGLIQSTPSLRAALVRQLTDKNALRKIDAGTFVLENSEGRLLATRALSFSTSGRARLANKPFSILFGVNAHDLDQVDYSALSFVKSADGLVERMNNSSCIGCHQSGGTAGFHMLGFAGELNSTFNQVILPFSPHYFAERTRRSDYLNALMARRPPASFRPLSISPATGTAHVRELCLPAGSDFSSGIGCEAGSECRVNVQNAALGVGFGECIRKVNSVAGHVCREGVVTNAPMSFPLGDLSNLRSFNDHIDISRTNSLPGLGCGNPKGGVPLGRIAKLCDSNTAAGRLEFVDALKPGAAPPEEICAMRGGPQFDECAKSANPPNCLAKAKIVRALLDSCSIGRFCREDYICQQLPTDLARLFSGAEKNRVADRIQKLAERGIGFCVPNYFVFNMRSDGHIIPEGRNGP